MPGHLAIVPAYNEAASIAPRRHGAASTHPDFDVLVVDDGSTDDTARPRAARPAPRCSVTRSTSASAAPCSRATMYALEHGYDVAVQVDGDGQHDPRHLADLLEHLRDAPGARHGHGLALPRRTTATATARRRRAGSGSASSPGVLSLHRRPQVTDPTSGFRMAGRRGIELFARDYPHDYPEVEAVLLLHAHQLASVELPVQHARAHRRRLLDQLDALGLLHDQGAARGLRRAAARAPDGRAPATTPRSPAEHAI